MLAEGKISRADLDLMLVTDDVAEAVRLVVDACEAQGRAIRGRAQRWLAEGRRPAAGGQPRRATCADVAPARRSRRDRVARHAHLRPRADLLAPPPSARSPSLRGPAVADATVSDLRQPALVLDRQRRLARSGPADGRGAAGRRRRAAARRDRRRRRVGGARQRHRRATPATTRRRSTRQRASSRCCPSGSRPTSPRSARARTAWRSSPRSTSIAPAACCARRCRAPLVRNHAKLAYDSVAAWLEGSASPARGRGARARHRRATPSPGRPRADAPAGPPRARRARPRDHRAQSADAERRTWSSSVRSRKNRAREPHRGRDDRRQRRDRAFPRRPRLPVAPPRDPRAAPLGPDRRARRRPRHRAARDPRCGRRSSAFWSSVAAPIRCAFPISRSRS